MKPEFSISIIGSGNVATQLGRALLKYNIKIDIIFNYNIHSADLLAKDLNSKASNQPKDLPTDSDLYIIALKDEHILASINQFDLKNKLIVHTSGTFDTQLLNKITSRVGCFYPMQTLTKNEEIVFENTAVFIEANLEEDIQLLKKITNQLNCTPFQVNQLQRQQLHIAAIATNNFTYHLFSCIQEYCNSNNLPYSSLGPLLSQTIKMIDKENPFMYQTGPAKRGENEIIEKHMDLLKSEEFLADIYSLFTTQIKKKHQNNEL